MDYLRCCSVKPCHGAKQIAFATKNEVHVPMVEERDRSGRMFPLLQGWPRMPPRTTLISKNVEKAYKLASKD